MANKIRTLTSVKIEGKTVIVRSNFNVPILNGEIEDDTIIKAASQTLQYLIERNCKIILLSHLGEPKGEYKDELSLMPVRFALGNILSKPIKFADIKHSENSIKFMEPGEILLLENLKFNPEEESKDSEVRNAFVKPLSKLADYYINDDFASEENLASTIEMPAMMRRLKGIEVEKEEKELSEFKKIKNKPYTIIMGDSLSEESLSYLLKEVENADNILVGFPAALAFFEAQGFEVSHPTEKAKLKMLKEIYSACKKFDTTINLPVDFRTENNDVKKINKIVENPADIGPETIELFNKVVNESKKILWYETLGTLEKGSLEVAENIVFNSPKDAVKIAGGTNLLRIFNHARLKTKRFNHISVGGKIMLNFLSN